MARSATLQSSFSGDPLYALERSRAEASGKRISKRDRLEMGNRPLPETPRRALIIDAESGSETPSPARQNAEAIFSGAALDEPKGRSAEWQALDALFDQPKP